MKHNLTTSALRHYRKLARGIAVDFFDVHVYMHEGKTLNLAKLRAAAKRRCPDITIELLPQTATVRVTRR